jgi:hypothetical protein
MKTREEDNVWKSLLAQSAPTFAGDLAPPLGLPARILAHAREASMQEALWERIGLRAILSAVAAVAVLAVITLATRHHDDVDVPVRGLAALEDIRLS